MFWSKKNTSTPETSTAVFQITDMHCTSCALNIDGTLEDLPGVESADTSYAKGHTQVQYDPKKVTTEQLSEAIQELGYTAQLAPTRI